MHNTSEFSGALQTDSGSLGFYCNNYSVILLDNKNSQDTANISPTDGFVVATDIDNHKILFYVGDDPIHVRHGLTLPLGSYITSTINIGEVDLSWFDGISFIGGTLQNLKAPERIKMNCTLSNGKPNLRYEDDSQKNAFHIGKMECSATMRSLVKENNGVNDRSIENKLISLDLEFPEKQLTSSVYSHYQKISTLLAFLTFRKNVGFDKIFLTQSLADTHITHTVAEVFIKPAFELTSKDYFLNIRFDDLGDSLSNLLNIIYNTTEQKPSYSLDFLPDNDECSNLITNNTIRGICSALECELSFLKGEISPTENSALNDLIKKIKEGIREHKESSGNSLSPKTYSLIHGSMSHWGMSAADQMIKLFHKYDDEMQALNISSYFISDSDIERLVKYRNEITHGSYCVLNPGLANTAYLLSGLIYCCLLTRIGVSRETILTFCKNHKICS